MRLQYIEYSDMLKRERDINKSKKVKFYWRIADYLFQFNNFFGIKIWGIAQRKYQRELSLWKGN